MNSNRSSEIVFPAASLVALRHALTEQIGSDAAALVLQRAGHAAGTAFHGLLSTEHDAASANEMEESVFWQRLNDLLSTRGWGSLAHDHPHPGVGSLCSAAWAEADPQEFASAPSCHFTTGLLANFLGRVAGSEIGVLEVECRSAGDTRCRFLFGGRDALHGVYAAIADGSDIDAALAELR